MILNLQCFGEKEIVCEHVCMSVYLYKDAENIINTDFFKNCISIT